MPKDLISSFFEELEAFNKMNERAGEIIAEITAVSVTSNERVCESRKLLVKVDAMLKRPWVAQLGHY
jgi:hypothetical protein